MNWLVQQTPYQCVIRTCKDEREGKREKEREISEVDDGGREEERRKAHIERAAESISVRRK